MVMESPWGELSSVKSGSVGKFPDLKLSFSKPQPIHLDISHLQQPTNHKQPTQLHPELCRPDYISIHTIQLLKHNRQLRSANAQLLHAEKSDIERKIPNIPPTPVLGSLKVLNQSETVESSTRSSPLILDEGTIEIDKTVTKQLSRRAVATICAHSGFETSQESALDCLTDVLHEYYLKFCKRLRLAVDREALYGTTSFQDVITDVFKDIGVESTEVLYQFWKTRIKDYHDFIERKNNKLQDQFQNLINPEGHSVESSTHVKHEPGSEIQFPDNFPNLLDQLPDASTSGITFQSLQSLELENSRTAASTSEDADAAQWLEGQIKLEATDKDSSANDSTDRNSQVGICFFFYLFIYIYISRIKNYTCLYCTVLPLLLLAICLYCNYINIFIHRMIVTIYPLAPHLQGHRTLMPFLLSVLLIIQGKRRRNNVAVAIHFLNTKLFNKNCTSHTVLIQDGVTSQQSPDAHSLVQSN